MPKFRKTIAAALIILGFILIVRGIGYSLSTGGPGWSGALQAAVVGGLVIALGLARWRYWQQR